VEPSKPLPIDPKFFLLSVPGALSSDPRGATAAARRLNDNAGDQRFGVNRGGGTGIDIAAA
jgi:hypothetical protein